MLREEHRLRIYEKSVLWRMFGLKKKAVESNRRLGKIA
jgi:hypothetical protein